MTTLLAEVTPAEIFALEPPAAMRAVLLSRLSSRPDLLSRVTVLSGDGLSVRLDEPAEAVLMINVIYALEPGPDGDPRLGRRGLPDPLPLPDHRWRHDPQLHPGPRRRRSPRLAPAPASVSRVRSRTPHQRSPSRLQPSRHRHSILRLYIPRTRPLDATRPERPDGHELGALSQVGWTRPARRRHLGVVRWPPRASSRAAWWWW